MKLDNDASNHSSSILPMKSKFSKFVTVLILATAMLAAPAAKADVRSGVLSEGERDSYNVFLEAGEYFEAAALADSDGLDIDLVALTPGGRVVDEDTLSDDEPVIRFYAPYAGTYRLIVSMPDTYRGRPAAYRLVTR